ncbi:MAG TPA: hypothetical protein VIV40_35640 [Kofleriaceae bacterium]
MRTSLWITAVLASACGHDDVRPDATVGLPADAQIAHDARPPDAADAALPPTLHCDPANADDETLCGCMANIVCDQIYACLPATEIATKPPYWSPKPACVESLRSDCVEDLGDPDLFPTDFRGCIRDLGTRSCAEFGHFTSVAASFPVTCSGLRALDTGLGIPQLVLHRAPRGDLP